MNDHKRGEMIGWIVHVLIAEGFSVKHLEALTTIIGLFNASWQSESQVVDFAKRLKAEHGLNEEKDVYKVDDR